MGNSKPILIAKDVKIMRFTARKAWSEKKAKGVGQSLASTLKIFPHREGPLKRYAFNSWIHSTILAEARTRDGIIQERPVRTLFSNGVNLHGIPGCLKRFLRMFYQQKH